VCALSRRCWEPVMLSGSIDWRSVTRKRERIAYPVQTGAVSGGQRGIFGLISGPVQVMI
jgi:hypothetical protein